jgi:hypothetical protein
MVAGPPTPQYWGTSEPGLFQSPPELGDLGGQPPLQQSVDLALHRSIIFASLLYLPNLHHGFH